MPLKRMLRDAHLFWSGPGEGKGLAMHAALNDCPERIFGDEARLRQIIFNLMSNATKFTSEGEVSAGGGNRRAGGRGAVAGADQRYRHRHSGARA